MTRFNTPQTPTLTENLAGGTAYPQSSKQEIAAILLTSFAQDKFYRSAGRELNRLRGLVASDPLFAAKAAVYARNEYGMRSITHVVAGEVPEYVKGERWVKDFITACVRRPDDMTEIIAYRSAQYGLHPLPNALKKGLRNAFGKFDAYQLAKYRAGGKSISLIDVVNLVRPVPSERNATALHDLMHDSLRNTGTWEAKMSSGEDKAEAWGDLLAEDKLGYMALLKNLRNIAAQADDETFELALTRLTDSDRIRKSLVLPFRYYTAYKELARTRYSPPTADDVVSMQRQPGLIAALSMACDTAVGNVPDLKGTTLVALDTSGSMTGGHISKSDLLAIEIGALFAAALVKRMAGRAHLLTFDTQASIDTVNTNESILSITDRITREARGGGTNMDLVFSHSMPFDRVIVLSDMQSWINGEWGSIQDSWGRSWRQAAYGEHRPANDALNQYRQRTGSDPHVYGFDLMGYGSMQFPAPKCYQLAGWSEKVFDVMGLLEQDRDALVKVIEEVEF